MFFARRQGIYRGFDRWASLANQRLFFYLFIISNVHFGEVLIFLDAGFAD